MAELKNIRNIGIIAHIDAGKTTTTERVLYYTKKIHKIGEIDDGAATMDFMDQERERGITIASAAVTTQWRGKTINIIDTPGHVDFTAEVERSLRVLDGAVAVISAVDGAQPQTETVWKQADEFGVPRLCFVNKMDRLGADFFAAVDDVESKFGVTCVRLQVPIGQGADFEGVIDLLSMQELRFDPGDDGATVIKTDIAQSRLEEAKKWRDKAVDQAASADDELAEIYLDGKEISQDMLKTALRKETIGGLVVPCLCGSSRHNQGIQPLMDAVADYLPSPLDVTGQKALRVKKSRHDESAEEVAVKCDESGPLAALVFKIQHDVNMGAMCFVRVYSGKMTTGCQVYNVNKKKRERVNKLYRIDADNVLPIESVSAGDIACVIGLKVSQTGDTLSSEGLPMLLEKPVFPQPVISVALEPESLGERGKMMDTLAILAREDPTFTYHEDEETGQLIISGMGELHLDVLTTRMQRDFKVNCRVGQPQVTYREAVMGEARVTHEFSRVLAGKENTAVITVEVRPSEAGQGNRYECTAKHFCREGDIPDEIFDAMQSSFEASLQSGIKYGYPCTDTTVCVTDIVWDAAASTPFAFSSCAALAFDEAASKAAPALLEPVMSVDISTPKEFVGEAMSQVTSRGGMILGQDSKGAVEIIKAEAPMAKMFGFTTSLRSATQGRASFSMSFSRFQEKVGGLG